LEAQTPPEVVPAGSGLVFPADDRPVKAVVNSLFGVAGEVEQAADLAEGQADQPARRVSVAGVVISVGR